MISIISPTVGLNVSPASASLGREASTGSFNVTSNASWSWSSSASWVLAGEPATQSGNQLFEYSVASNTGSGSRTATITLTAGAATATHTITQVGAGGDDHGNSIATATAISPNSTTSGTIGFPGDNDYFRIVVSGPGTLVVRSTGSTDTYGYLLNSSGVLLASDDESYGTNFEVGITVPAAGTPDQ